VGNHCGWEGAMREAYLARGRGSSALVMVLVLAGCGGGGDGGGTAPGTMRIAVTAATPSQIDYQFTPPQSGSYSYLAVSRNGAPLGTHLPANTTIRDGTVGPNQTHCYQAFAITFPVGTTDSSNVSCATTPGATPGWTIATLGPGGLPAMVADSAGDIHLVYANGAGIQYRRYAGGAWSADSLVEAGSRPSLAIDSTDRLHLTYGALNAGLTRVRYAAGGLSGWTIETITSHASGTDSNGGIAVNANGSVAFASYWHCPVGCEEYWRTSNASGSWQSIFPVSSQAAQPRQRSVAVDPAGNAYFLSQGLSGSLMTVRKLAGVTETQVLSDSAAAAQSGAAMHRGQAAGISAGYWRAAGNWTLVLVTGLDSTPTELLVDQTSWVPGAVSLWEDGGGAPHLCYSDANNDLRHASRVGGAWQIAFVDAVSTTGDCAIAVDGAGRVHIVYTDFATQTLKHAVR
jgi:hypothetical protein